MIAAPGTAPVLLPRFVHEELAREAQRALPGECCGALLGRVRADGLVVQRALPLPNQATSPRGYLVGPESVRAAEEAAARAELELVGFYHSHPETTAVPSPADLEAGWPWYVYLVVAAGTGEARAWTLAEDRSAFGERPVAIEEGA